MLHALMKKAFIIAELRGSNIIMRTGSFSFSGLLSSVLISFSGRLPLTPYHLAILCLHLFHSLPKRKTDLLSSLREDSQWTLFGPHTFPKTEI